MPGRKTGEAAINRHKSNAVVSRPRNLSQFRKKRRLGVSTLMENAKTELKCPRCFHLLSAEAFKGIDIMRCKNCGGLWLDAPKLDRLEDTVFPDDEVKGTVIFNTERSSLLCPVCLQFMKRFNYRDYDLSLDFCPDHGYWLDKGEEKRVVQLMKEEARAWVTKSDAEEKWPDMLLKLKTPSFWNRLTSMLP